MTPDQLTDPLAQEIDVLVYVGNKDWYCNAGGMRYWVNHLPWRLLARFRSPHEEPWVTAEGVWAGSRKCYDRLTFVEVFDAGHMVPMDKGPEAVSLVNWWMDKSRS